MATVAPPPQPETKRVPDVPEVLFPEARRRRRRRWLTGAAVATLAAAIVGAGLAAAGSGSGGGGARAAATDPPTGAPGTAPGPAGDLAGGKWSPLAPPSGGAEKSWYLAAWTGKYVIAWGSGSPCCTTPAGRPANGSSEQGAAFNPASNTWRSIPPAPVDFTVESTAWTGRQVLVWGSATGRVAGTTRNVLWGFDPATWRWKRLAPPPIGPRSDARVLWGGTRLIVVGGQGPSALELLNGAAYNPANDRWSLLPAMPHFVSGPGSKEEPVGLTPAWANGALYVWVTRQVSRSCGTGCGEISAKVQALRWSPGSSRWLPGPTPPPGVSILGSTSETMGTSIALLGGSSCLPEMSCLPTLGKTFSLWSPTTGKWSSIPSNAALRDEPAFAWTGRRLVAVSPYLTTAGYVVGGYAAAFRPVGGSWNSLPSLPVPMGPPTGPAFSGTVWTGSELIYAGLVLKPGDRAPSRATSTAVTVPSCPPINFPEWVGGTFCGPAPGPGNGSGPGGSCLGSETAPPCGPGMVAGRYYAYTIVNTCANEYIDGRWWKAELQGGSGTMNVWISVNAGGSGAGWIGPNGAVGFVPSAANGCT